MSTLDELVAAVPRPGHPHYSPASGHGSALADVARAIRAAVPIAGDSATNDECATRDALVEGVLETLDVPAGPRAWWTVVAEDQPGELVPVFGGVWASSFDEAVIEVVLWRPEFDGRHLERIVVDDGCRLHAELTERRRKLELRDEIDSSAVTLW